VACRTYTKCMKPPGAALALVFLCAGCSSEPVSVVGTWQAFLGSGTAAKQYYGKPAPTVIEFRDDGTYTVHLMWGARSIAESGGSYEVSDDKLTLNPRESLDHDTWLGKEEVVLDPNGRAFTLQMPSGSRVREARFYKVRTY